MAPLHPNSALNGGPQPTPVLPRTADDFSESPPGNRDNDKSSIMSGIMPVTIFPANHFLFWRDVAGEKRSRWLFAGLLVRTEFVLVGIEFSFDVSLL